MTIHHSTACPVCTAGEVELHVTITRGPGDTRFGEAEIVYQTCECELDPSQREALERSAVEDVAWGGEA